MSLESQQIETKTTIPPPQKKVKLDEDSLPRDDDSSIRKANGAATPPLNGNVVDAPLKGNEKQPDPVNNNPPPPTSTDAPLPPPPSNGNVDDALNGNDKQQLGPVNNDPPTNSPPPKNNLKRPFESIEADGENENEAVVPENVLEPNEEGDEEEGEDDEDDDDVDVDDEDEDEEEVVEIDQQKEEVTVNTATAAAAGDEGAEDDDWEG